MIACEAPPDLALKHQPSGERWFHGKRWGWVLVGMGGKGGGIRNVNGGISLDFFCFSNWLDSMVVFKFQILVGRGWRFWGEGVGKKIDITKLNLPSMSTPGFNTSVRNPLEWMDVQFLFRLRV